MALRPALGASGHGISRSILGISLKEIIRCRVCLRVTMITFLAILLVEAIILIPSAWNYERDRLHHLEDMGKTAALGILTVAGESPQPRRLRDSALIWFGQSPLTGVRITPPQGESVTVGEPPVLDTHAEARTSSRRIDSGTRYEARWTLPSHTGQWTITGRMDAQSVQDDLRGFIVRIIGLVLLIAAFVTAATMFVLGRAVLHPVLELRQAMQEATRNPEAGHVVQGWENRRDELGEMEAAFAQMSRHVAQNLRDLKEARLAADQANAAKSAFLAAMSHELRTPLNAVIGFSEVIESEAFGPIGTPKYKEYVTDIHASGVHLLGLINDILDLSKAESGHMELNESEVSLKRLDESSRRMVAERAERAGVELVGALPDLTVLADEARLRQVLLNLLSNAVKFTPKGGRVTLDGTRAPSGDVVITVADTGVGIAPEDIPKVFEPFQQADNQSKDTRTEGTGLGMPISRRLVEMHGGALTLESRVGQGTTVFLTLPARRVLGETAPLSASAGR